MCVNGIHRSCRVHESPRQSAGRVTAPRGRSSARAFSRSASLSPSDTAADRTAKATPTASERRPLVVGLGEVGCCWKAISGTRAPMRPQWPSDWPSTGSAWAERGQRSVETRESSPWGRATDSLLSAWHHMNFQLKNLWHNLVETHHSMLAWLRPTHYFGPLCGPNSLTLVRTQHTGIPVKSHGLEWQIA